MTITNKVSLKSVNAGNSTISDVPDAPTVSTVTDAFDGTATVAATAAATGGTPTTYTITPTPTTSPATFTGTSPVTVSGLSDGTTYTFTAAGVNSTATGPAGSSSSSFTPVVAGSFYSIATTTVGAGGTSSITFSSIPQTYTHLQIRGIPRTPGNATFMSVTTSAGTNYGLKGHYLLGNGSAASAGVLSTTASKGLALDVYVGSLVSNQFGVNIIDILDYTNTNKYKTVKAITGYDDASSSLNFISHLYDTTNAITSITLFANGNYPQYSSFALYGVIA